VISESVLDCLRDLAPIEPQFEMEPGKGYVTRLGGIAESEKMSVVHLRIRFARGDSPLALKGLQTGRDLRSGYYGLCLI
jgi:hypothetical protein